ncbi:tetratricopeptide repeat domain containing protein [Acanthamoeba castellanii str. Neff]|uniref:Tetratricopeptide repeat domain containing protein n=1 Tax=Acanthamoeba castellanii (strain ATCC 30010 / Neff) TaxID=1257118 RepID=L8GWN4_ACACF|nr:tetratricopeptide repeat domain containing protein [Acanthamoeba castellanii str. Neff]ELR17609.1 tetratricopeptide repeat domain containing protein [Acanthamoeba castellanii str. Neff]
MEAKVKEANALFLQGKHSPAVALYTAAIEAGAAYLRLGLYRKCLADCEAALRLQPADPRPYLLKGKALVGMNKSADAEAAWRAGLDKADGAADVELLLQLQGQLNPPVAAPAIATAPAASSEPKPAVITNGEAKATITTPSPQASAVPRAAEPAGKTKSPAPAQQPKKEAKSPPTAAAVAAANPNDLAEASAMVAARGLVQHGSGNTTLDEKIAMGYLHVNTGNFPQAIKLFNVLVNLYPKLVAAYLGRGTAYALSGHLSTAVEEFSAAIKIDDTCMEAWKRRGQSRAAMGQDAEAVLDLTRAAELAPKDADIYHQRGLIYFKLRNYGRAAEDFRRATAADAMSKLSWNHLGLCLNALGRPMEAIQAHKRALELDPAFREALANIGQAYKDYGNSLKAEKYFAKGLKVDPNYMHAFHLRGLARFGAGDHRGALSDFTAALRVDDKHKDSRLMRGIVLHGLGRFREAVADYDVLVREKPDHVAWYNRQIALWTHHHLDTPVAHFNIDRVLNAYFKEAWCKRLDPATLTSYTSQPPINNAIADVALNDELRSEHAKLLIRAAVDIGKKIQLNCPGYLANQRQQRACGFAIIELAQTLRRVWAGEETQLSGKASSLTDQPHTFAWRDLYDIPIRWRQFSEPNDPVWWVDLLSPEQFAEGFGSHTPMVTGQTYVVRYSPMAPRAIRIMREQLQQSPLVSQELRHKLTRDNLDCKTLHEAVQHDFWVVTPCHSLARPNRIMEGTRLTIQRSPPEGYEFSIRTPGTPNRWQEYNAEMAHNYRLLQEEASKPHRDLSKLTELVLHMAFYWYNFMPLSRGTAAVGLVTVHAMFLALGFEMESGLPQGLQPDWEGILTARPSDFVKCLRSAWIDAACRPTTTLDALPLVAQVCPTLRHMVLALNAAS